MLKIVISCTAALMILFSALCILTPERDKFGNYTNPVQYWTNNAYFNTHFK